jgi:X-X-X-Leu-X-X-Gly heptad repeat protein
MSPSLSDQASINSYVSAMQKVFADWSRRPSETQQEAVERRQAAVKEALDNVLEASGLPKVKLELQSLNPSPEYGIQGYYIVKDQIIFYNRAAFETPQLSAKAAETLVGVLYHEARHAEQFHQVAKSEIAKLPVRSQPALDNLATRLGINNSIVNHAAQQINTQPLTTEQAKQAAIWQQSLYGTGTQQSQNIRAQWANSTLKLEQERLKLDQARNTYEQAQAKYPAGDPQIQAAYQQYIKAYGVWQNARHAFAQLDAKYKAIPEEADGNAIQQRVIETHRQNIEATRSPQSSLNPILNPIAANGQQQQREQSAILSPAEELDAAIAQLGRTIANLSPVSPDFFPGITGSEELAAGSAALAAGTAELAELTARLTESYSPVADVTSVLSEGFERESGEHRDSGDELEAFARQGLAKAYAAVHNQQEQGNQRDLGELELG